ncbi:nicotinamide riboside transporter PnuC [Neolewinella agarilytica]|uniref:Nicotinamide riboside transporter PnuC n=1 Tax=Neolewinella agarilytica TaxID=478744 RepID=A0A1H9BI98_9BACT|nr:nicotinamide riboside transporter PnuC [Neolewinella agarilytica]SEP88447.1 nicotinamide mononucleotide transporter [Neolewinella agarilytica]
MPPSLQRTYWPLALTSLALVFCLATKTDWLTTSTVVSGVACVSLIAIGKRLGYLIGLVSSITYAWIAYQNGLFGEVGLNILFYLPTGVAGYFMWAKNEANGTVNMQRLASRQRRWLVLGSVLATIVLGLVLRAIPGQNSPFVDAATNVLSIIATLLMMWRFAEQWWLYVALNVLTVSLWTIRYLADGYAADRMIFLWLIYLINSVFGLIIWARGVEKRENT